MVSVIFPRAYQCYLSLPILGPILDEFTGWSLRQGYTTNTIKEKVWETKKIDKLFLQHGVNSLNELSHEEIDRACRHLPRSTGTIRQLELIIDETHGLPSPLPKPKSRISTELEHYTSYLRDIDGFAETTIRSHKKYIQDFLEHICYEHNPEAIKSLTHKQIEGFTHICSKKMNRYSLQHLIGYVRSFLRFQYEQGALESPLHTMIDTPRIYRLEQIPRSLPRETIKDLLRTIKQDNALGLRDYTMLYLTAAYGLRAIEVVSLKLDDINWRGEVIHIPQNKTGAHLILPLTNAVGNVLVNYLKKGRPKASHRELFLRARAPYGPLKPSALKGIFKRRILVSGLDIPFQGIHCLRHSYAVHLLQQGSSVKSIGDLLGHKNAESTCVYLRLAIEDLRCVGLDAPCERDIGFPKNLILENYYPANNKNRNDAASLKTNSPSSSLKSFLAQIITDYLQLKKSLGRNYRTQTHVLCSFDAFLAKYYPLAGNLTLEMFDHWCNTVVHLSSGVRRKYMFIIRNLCLYHCRSYPGSFVPDILAFPKSHQTRPAYIFSTSEIARLMATARYLRPYPAQRFPLRSETLRMAILILYTTGLRLRELLNLELSDFNQEKMTLLIRNTKFHKSRIIPLSSSVTAELKAYLTLRGKYNSPMETESPLIWNGLMEDDTKSYTTSSFWRAFCALCKALKILTKDGKTPRVHDLRHSFAVNALIRWYQNDENVQAKLPLLATYMGHVSIVSTHYYLQFIEGIGLEVSERFRSKFGKVITNL